MDLRGSIQTVKRPFMFSVLKVSDTTFLCKFVFGEKYLKKSAFKIRKSF